MGLYNNFNIDSWGRWDAGQQRGWVLPTLKHLKTDREEVNYHEVLPSMNRNHCPNLRGKKILKKQLLLRFLHYLTGIWKRPVLVSWKRPMWILWGRVKVQIRWWRSKQQGKLRIILRQVYRLSGRAPKNDRFSNNYSICLVCQMILGYIISNIEWALVLCIFLIFGRTTCNCLVFCHPAKTQQFFSLISDSYNRNLQVSPGRIDPHKSIFILKAWTWYLYPGWNPDTRILDR